MLRALRYACFCLPLLAAGAAVAGAAQPTGTAQAAENTVTSTTFVVRGRGWGHGVGMGQWGAYGQAKRGVPYKKILAHYYRGTKLVRTRTASVRILLAEGRQQITVASEVPFRLLDGHGEIHDLAAGELHDEPGPQGGDRSRIAAARAARPIDLPPRLEAARALGTGPTAATSRFSASTAACKP